MSNKNVSNKTVSNKTVIAVAVVCVILLGLIVGAAFMMTSGKVGNSGNDVIYDAEFLDGKTLTWEELQNPANGNKYGYDASKITKNEIAAEAFKGSQVVSLKLPSTIMKIDSDAFDGADNLKAIHVVSENGVYASMNGVLYKREDTVLMRMPEGFEGTYDVVAGTKQIGASAFENCDKLAAVTLAEGLVAINGDAFDGAGISTITIPASVSLVQPTALSEVEKLTTINVAEGNETYNSVDGVLYNKKVGALVTYPSSKLENDYAIVEGTSMIMDEAFKGSRYLITIRMPHSVQKIGNEVFEDCNPIDNKPINLIYSGNATEFSLIAKGENNDALKNGLFKILYKPTEN